MTKINHENLSFKLCSKESSSCGMDEIPPMSVNEIQKDIYNCPKCSAIDNGFCGWHRGMMQGRMDLFNSPYNMKGG